MSPPQTAPFGDGSISLGLYVQSDLEPVAMVQKLRHLARLADKVGFDGVTLSEHHGGFDGYLPDPIQMIGVLLGEVSRAWAAPCPVLLPLRSLNFLIEEIAWLAATFPGRIGVGVAPGYSADDFEIAGVSLDMRAKSFRRALPSLVRALRGDVLGPLARDQAVMRCSVSPVPVVSAAAGPQTAARAAQSGSGIILGSFHSLERAAELFRNYVGAGGHGARILIRRVWVGNPPPNAAAALLNTHRSAGAGAWKTGPPDLIVGNAHHIAKELEGCLRNSGATSLSLRVHLPGTDYSQVEDQVAQLGRSVLPAVRANIRKTPH